VLVTLVFAAAATVARAEGSTLDRIEVQAPTVKRWGGRVLIVVGLWFLTLAVFADLFEGVFPV
jgi:hypothetical protein